MKQIAMIAAQTPTIRLVRVHRPEYLRQKSLTSDDLWICVRQPWIARQGQLVIVPASILRKIMPVFVRYGSRFSLVELVEAFYGDCTDGGPLTACQILKAEIFAFRKIAPAVGLEITLIGGHLQARLLAGVAA